MVELRDVNLKLAENHQESVEIAEKTQKVISDVKSGQSTSINLLDNISGILREQLKIQIKQAKILEGQRFDNLEAARENRRSMLRNARLGMAGAGAGAGAGGLGLGLGRGGAGRGGRTFLGTALDILGGLFLYDQYKDLRARRVPGGVKNPLQIPDFRAQVEADALRFTNNKTNRVSIDDLDVRARPIIIDADEYVDAVQQDLFDKPAKKPGVRGRVGSALSSYFNSIKNLIPTLPTKQAVDIFEEAENAQRLTTQLSLDLDAIASGKDFENLQKTAMDVSKRPPKVAGAGLRGSLKTFGFAFKTVLTTASGALVALDVYQAGKLALELRKLEKEKGRPLTEAEYIQYMKDTRGFMTVDEITGPVRAGQEAKSKEFFTNSVADGFRMGLEKAIQDNQIAIGVGAGSDGNILLDQSNNPTVIDQGTSVNMLGSDDTIDKRYGPPLR